MASERKVEEEDEIKMGTRKSCCNGELVQRKRAGFLGRRRGGRKFVA